MRNVNILIPASLSTSHLRVRMSTGDIITKESYMLYRAKLVNVND